MLLKIIKFIYKIQIKLAKIILFTFQDNKKEKLLFLILFLNFIPIFDNNIEI